MEMYVLSINHDHPTAWYICAYYSLDIVIDVMRETLEEIFVQMPDEEREDAEFRFAQEIKKIKKMDSDGKFECELEGIEFAVCGMHEDNIRKLFGGYDLASLMRGYLDVAVRTYLTDEDYKEEIEEAQGKKIKELIVTSKVRKLSEEIFQSMDVDLCKLVECEIRRILLHEEP